MSGQGWDWTVARYLVGHAARRAPPDLAARLEEEWLADLVARQGAFSRIRLALGCCWATRVIAREFGAVAATAGGAATGGQLLVSHAGFDFSRFSRRTVAMVAIVCLHIGLFALYLAGFGPSIVPSPTQPMTTDFVSDRPKPHRPAVLPSPTLAPTTVDNVPVPEVPLNFPAAPNVTITHSPLPNIPPLHAPPVTRTIGGPGAGFPNTEDYYPPAARRLGEAGITVVSVCVDARGSLTAAPALVRSSGIGLIDAGALRLARAGSGHYRPTTENGQPVSACYEFRIRFQLEDQ